MMTEQKRVATPSSGRTWKKGRLDDDDEMIPMVGSEADVTLVLGGLGGGGGGGGGKGGGGNGGGGTDLTLGCSWRNKFKKCKEQLTQ